MSDYKPNSHKYKTDNLYAVAIAAFRLAFTELAPIIQAIDAVPVTAAGT